jgi:hypothetical protein
MSSDNSSVDDDEYYNAKNFGKDKKEPKAGEKVVFETPVVETPVDETPVDETPVDETPVDETPVVETPVVETPVVETPVDDDEYYNAKNFGKDNAKAKKEPKAGEKVEDDGDY